MQFLEINSLATNTQKVEWASQNLQLDSKKIYSNARGTKIHKGGDTNVTGRCRHAAT